MDRGDDSKKSNFRNAKKKKKNQETNKLELYYLLDYI